jgi:peptidoglycan/LPS O-acetylase OafA/YrhL
MTSQKIGFADGLRGIAALSVITGHYLGTFWKLTDAVAGLTGIVRSPVVPPVFVELVVSSPVNLGAFGVALFFLISGFVIPLSFQSYGRLDFLVARFFRIYPTYWVGLSVSLVVLVIGGSLLGTPFPHSAVEVLYGYLIGTRDIAFVKSVDGVVWTIEIELKFYLICALIAPWLREGSLKVFWIPCVLLVIACTLGVVLIPSATATTLYFALLSAPYLLFMFIGVAFNFLYRGKLQAPAAGLAVLGMMLMFGVAQHFNFLAYDSFLLSFVAAVAAFAAAMRFPNIVGSIPLIGFWADISYPLYVVHGLTGYVLMEVLLARGFSSWFAILIAFAAVTTLAVALHVTVETSSREMGRRMAMAIRGRYAMSEAEARVRAD